MMGLVLLVLVAVPLGASLVTKAGPPRVYLSLTPFLCIGVASGLWIVYREAVCFRARAGVVAAIVMLALVTAVLCRAGASVNRWEPPDWGLVFDRVQERFPENVYLCFPATAGYPLRYNRPQALHAAYERVKAFGGQFVQLGYGGELSGMDLRTGDTGSFRPAAYNVAKQESVGGIPARIYDLVPIGEVAASDGTVVAVIGPGDPARVKSCVRALLTDQTGKWLLLNLWMSRVSERGAVGFGVFASRNPTLTREEMLGGEKISGGLTRFYMLGGGGAL